MIARHIRGWGLVAATGMLACTAVTEALLPDDEAAGVASSATAGSGGGVLPPSCSDGQQNAGETDLDCGGPCLGCANGRRCVLDDDCQSRLCLDAVCSACTTSSECATGFYCAPSGACLERAPAGNACSTAEECLSGFCANEVCCDGACDATCSACVAAATGVEDGTCAAVEPGKNDGDCSDGGTCTGGGTCCGGAPAPTGTAFPPICDGVAGGTCQILADQDQEFQGGTIDCPPGFDCHVVCSGNQACKGASILCPESGHRCQIDCNCMGNDVQCCEQTAVSCASGPCAMACGSGNNPCANATLTCGPNACTATCTGPSLPVVSCGASCGCTTC